MQAGELSTACAASAPGVSLGQLEPGVSKEKLWQGRVINSLSEVASVCDLAGSCFDGLNRLVKAICVYCELVIASVSSAMDKTVAALRYCFVARAVITVGRCACALGSLFNPQLWTQGFSSIVGKVQDFVFSALDMVWALGQAQLVVLGFAVRTTIGLASVAGFAVQGIAGIVQSVRAIVVQGHWVRNSMKLAEGLACLGMAITAPITSGLPFIALAFVAYTFGLANWAADRAPSIGGERAVRNESESSTPPSAH